MLDENSVVRLLKARFGGNAPRLKKGIGDDAAVFHPRGAGEYWVVTTDLLLEDIDFRRNWLSPAQLGHKSLAANLSDLAAMGAKPRFFTVALALPKGIPKTWITCFYEGLTRLGHSEGAALIGGDLSRSASGIHVSITALGESYGRKLVYRSGGKPGDAVFVTGVLGRSAAGLALLQSGCLRGNNRPQSQALLAHRMPVPRCGPGFWLAQKGLAGSMMDLSDGLSVDLPRLCEASGTGAEIESGRLPVFEGAAACGCDPLELALHGGEDFELLFTVAGKKEPLLERMYPPTFPAITRVGRLTADPGVITMRNPEGVTRTLTERGFDHFRK